MVYRHYGSSVESKRDEILRNYEAAGVSLDTAKNESGYDEVDTEVMAAFVEEKLLTDYDTILSTVKADRTLGERILDWLNKVLTKITGTKEQRFLIEAREKWSRALEEEREENKKAPERAGEARKHSINKEEQKQEEAAFVSEIEAWNREGKSNGDTFVLGSTGEVLQGLGAIESDIYIKASKINTILKEHPEMTLAEIKKIPQILNNPIMILKSRNAGRAKQQNSRLVIFGSIKAQNGKPVLTVLDLKPIENHLVINDMQKVTSAYTKTSNPVDFVRSSYVLYVDDNKKRAASLLQSIGFQMPIEWQRVGSIGSIQYAGKGVKTIGESFSKIVKKSSRYSIGTAEDTAYLEAVERGDMALSERFNEGNDDIRYSIGYTEDNEPFVEVDRDILDGVPRKDWVKTVKNNLRDRFPDGVHVGNELIRINQKSRQEMAYSEYTKYLRRQYPNLYMDKLRATNNADEIIKASRNYIGEGLKHPRNDKIVEFAYGTVLLRIGNNDYSAKVVVGTQKNGSLLLYDIVSLKPTVINKKSQVQGKADNEHGAQNSRRTVPDEDSISNSSQNVKKKFSIGTTDLKVDKETRDLITAHNTAMREVFYSRSRADQSELWDLIKDEMAHILKTGAARRKVVDDIVQLAYDTGYRIARRENEAVNTWGKGIYMPEKYTGEMASLGGLKAVNNQLMGSGLYFTYQRKKKDSNVNYGSLDEAYSDLSDANPMLPETMDPAEQVQAIIDLFGSKNRHQSLHELDEEAYEMGEDSKPYLTDIRNAVNEAMDDISTMARYKMIQAARKSGEAEGRKKGAAEQRKAQQKTEEATMREYDKLRQKLAKDERKDAEATMRMHDKLIEEVRKEERNLSEKEKADIRRKVKAKEREWDKEVKRQAAEFKREQQKKLRNADKNLDAALREAEKERKKREKYLSDAEKKNAQKRMKEIDAERRKERIETAKEEYRRNNPPPKTGTTADLYRKNCSFHYF